MRVSLLPFAVQKICIFTEVTIFERHSTETLHICKKKLFFRILSAFALQSSLEIDWKCGRARNEKRA